LPLVRPRSSPKSLANLPSVPRAFELLHRARGGEENEIDARNDEGRGGSGRGRRERLEGERIYLNISGNLGTKHALRE